MLEKATRVLTHEDREMMDRPIEGRNGELRKIEVSPKPPIIMSWADISLVPARSTEAEEGLPVRGEIQGDGSSSM